MKSKHQIFTSIFINVRVFCLGISLVVFTACMPVQEQTEIIDDVTEKQPYVSEVENTAENSFSLEFGHSIYANGIATKFSVNDDVTFSIIESPQFGEVKLVDKKTGAFEYHSTSSDSQFDYFTVSATTSHDSDTKTVELRLEDKSAPQLLFTYPSDKSVQISQQPKIQLVFDDLMDINSFSINILDNACIGSVQISQNNFRDCIKVQSITSTNGLHFELTLDETLNTSTKYEVRLSNEIRNRVDLPLEKTQFSFLTAIDHLVISEVGVSYHDEDFVWFEIFNFSSESVKLSDFTMRSGAKRYRDGKIDDDKAFNLPNITLHPGEYYVLSSKHPEGSFDALSVVKQSEFRPFWSTSGFIEILNKQTGKSIDFVRFGEDQTLPKDLNAWVSTQNADSLTLDNEKQHRVIARYANNQDSNTYSDWVITGYANAGLANDAECTYDEDTDGIPDCQEAPGKTYSNLPLYDWGARPNQTDIFIEVDYIASADPGVTPHAVALQQIATAFIFQNIHLHFDAGALPSLKEGVYSALSDRGGSNIISNMPYIVMENDESINDANNFYNVKYQNSDIYRQNIFYYALFGTTMNKHGRKSASGRAEIYGNDLLITLQGWELNQENQLFKNRLINTQAATLMHELGHNLGLRHGGFEDLNFKPNYLSVMNYLYQIEGLPKVGVNDGDRFYFRFYGNEENSPCIDQELQIHQSSWVSPYQFTLDFSHGKNQTLEKHRLVESNGIGREEAITPVDFNCDGDFNDVIDYAQVVEKESNNNHPYLKDHNDWDNLWFYYHHQLSQRSGFNLEVSTQSRLTKSKYSAQQGIEPNRELSNEVYYIGS
ncbi:MAG: Ig-like domain-containing protein [Pseudomonadota bacterium]